MKKIFIVLVVNVYFSVFVTVKMKWCDLYIFIYKDFQPLTCSYYGG